MKYFFVLLYSINLSFSATISGTIRNNSTGEPLSYTNIVILESELGTASDVNGYYIIPSVENGTFIIKFMMMGYSSLEKELIISDSNIRVDINLDPEILDINEVKVSAERMRFEKKVDVSRVNLSNREIRRTPAFVEADVFRTIQLLPSVTASNDFNAALIVRGGSPDENLILLDGAEIYNPYHIGGVFSAFNADMISEVEFLAGGFPAEYGGRLSSVLSITGREGDSKNGRLKDGNPLKKYWDFSKASGDISLLSAKLLAEGSLYNGSWMISGRRTYFDQFTGLYYKIKDEPEPFNYYFWDTHIKLKTSLSPSNQLTYSQFSGNDNLFISLGGDSFPEIAFDWDWGNYTNNLTWKYIPSNNYFIESNLSRTIYDFTVGFDVDFVTDSTEVVEDGNEEGISDEDSNLGFDIYNFVEDISLTQSATYVYSEDLRFKMGWQFKKMNMDYKETFAGIERIQLISKPKINSVFFSSIFRPLPIFSLSLGSRLSQFSSYSKTLIDPRIAVKYNVSSDFVLKGSWGIFSQFLYTLNQEDELLRIVDFWQPIPDGEKPQKAEHFIIGGEYWISNGNTISLEGYYKKYYTLYDLNPVFDPANIANSMAVSGTGSAYGIEFLYRLRFKSLSGWIGYAHSNFMREIDLNSDGVIWEERENYPAKYNKPQSFMAVFSYKLNNKYNLGMTCVYESGQTYTAVIGKVHQAGQQNFHSLEKPYDYFGNIYGKRNGSSYPNYIRVDLNVSRKSKLFGLPGAFKVQIINVMNYYNVLLYNWNHDASPSKVEAYSMFPRVITFGWEFTI
jgi:hypothetical protein